MGEGSGTHKAEFVEQGYLISPCHHEVDSIVSFPSRDGDGSFTGPVGAWHNQQHTAIADIADATFQRLRKVLDSDCVLLQEREHIRFSDVELLVHSMFGDYVHTLLAYAIHAIAQSGGAWLIAALKQTDTSMYHFKALVSFHS